MMRVQDGGGIDEGDWIGGRKKREWNEVSVCQSSGNEIN